MSISRGCATCHLDWFSGTTSETDIVVIKRLRDALGNTICNTSAAHAYGFKVCYCITSDTEELCKVYSGAQHGRTLIEATGTQPNDAVRHIIAQCEDPHATRVDSAIDFAGDFQQWVKTIDSIIKRLAARGRRPETERTVSSPNGCTHYWGSSKSVVQLRLYEKSKEQASKGFTGYPAGMLRAEVQWRPEGANRVRAMTIKPLDIWGANSWLHGVAQAITSDRPLQLSNVREAGTWDTRYHWLCQQCSPTFVKAVGRYGLGKVLADMGVPPELLTERIA